MKFTRSITKQFVITGKPEGWPASLDFRWRQDGQKDGQPKGYRGDYSRFSNEGGGETRLQLFAHPSTRSTALLQCR